MKKIYLLLLLLLFSCAKYDSKIYICGDHPCKNKKEIEEYFANNISIEVYVVESKNKQLESRDLTDINLSNKKNIKQNVDPNKLSFLKKRNLELKNKSKEKPLKLKLTKDKINDPSIKNIKNENKLDLSKPNFTFKKSKTKKIVHLCKNIKECDIDIIAKKINDLGKDKSFPDITFGK